MKSSMRGALVVATAVAVVCLPWLKPIALAGDRGDSQAVGDAARPAGTARMPRLVEAALDGEPSHAERAVAELRSFGKKGLDYLFAIRDAAIEGDADNQQAATIARIDALIDRVGGARYCSRSRLFWYTDLETAKHEAVRTGKPILSLRMMGKLTDEYSCANSRFFRTTLYANQEISKFLGDKFVLHWRSVRPVPKVTIDFGDGRVLRRTLTGNSIHYVLDDQGHVLDGLPGLYGPARFLGWLKEMSELGQSVNRLPDRKQWTQFSKIWHSRKAAEISRRWRADLQRVNAPPTAAVAVPKTFAKGSVARRATAIARPKSAVEMPMIASVTMETKNLEGMTDDKTWERIAALHSADARLDGNSRRLIRSENPTAAEASPRTVTKRRQEDPVLKLIFRLESSIALDTVRNEYLLHQKLHTWFASATAPSDVEKLNERVYTELFLTPSSDPWIGLVPAGTYTGLNNGGVE